MKNVSVVSVNNKKISAIIAIVIFIVTTSIHALAVTENGWCTTADITPANRVLYGGYDTGITLNEDSIEVYAACASTPNGYGAVFVTTNPNYNGVRLRNVRGQSYFWENVRSINYNGHTFYIANADVYSTSINANYPVVTFDSSWQPSNANAQNFLNWIVDEEQEPINSYSLNYSLPAGNIAIIETDSSYSFINMITTMPLQSTSFASNPWPNTTQRIGFYSTLPQTLNPNTMGNVVEWVRNGNTTLFNITTSAKYNPSIVSTFNYVVIANPYYYPANDMDDSQYTNGAINISMDGVVNITVKSLTATVNTQTGAVEDNYNGNEWTGEVDETTNDIIWTDSNGDSSAPTEGGNLSDPSITGFESWLKGILNNIVNIFQPAHDAINTLSSAVSNFASWMYALYVWLPSPILSLLTSAISLAIVIGIIKVFI